MKILQFIKNNIPNSITCMNLFSGAIACIYAMHSTEQFGSLMGYQIAFIFIGMAAVFDFFDGFAARLLHSVSGLGKELDSLSDSISFGLAPGILTYALMETQNPGSIMNYIALLLAVFGALRLARFNIDDSQSTTFLGLPIPANAIFWIGCINYNFANGYMGNTLIILLVLLFSYLMVCNLRMFSLKVKNLSFKDNALRYILIIATLLFVIFTGITGFAYTIALYVVLSVVEKFTTKA